MDIVSKITGNTCSATEFNQIPTELEAVQTSSGQTSSDAILNQVSIGVSRYAANNFYLDSGTADNYLLTLAASMTNPVSATVGYFIGMTIRFRAGNAGTGGAATVNVNNAGVKSLKEADGTTNPSSIPTTEDSEYRYDGTVFRKVNVTPATQAQTNAGSDDTRFITPLKLRFGFAASFTTNGYIAFPSWLGGLVVQWGTGTTTAGTLTQNYPIPFPNAILGKYAIGVESGFQTTLRYVSIRGSSSTTQIVVDSIISGVGAVLGINWLAIGN